MKQILLLLSFLFLFAISLSSQRVGINTSGASPDPSAILDVKSETGGILIPRVSTTMRDNITSPATGLLIYDTDFSSFYFYNGSAWVDISINANSLTDTDGDTKIYVEKAPDQDAIRLELVSGNFIKVSISATGQLLIEPFSFGSNLFLGESAGSSTDISANGFNGRFNTFLGYEAGRNNTIGRSNTFVGAGSGDDNVDGKDNTFIGTIAGAKNTAGAGNTVIGKAANLMNEVGINNTVVGSEAGGGTTEHSKSGNVFIGYRAGYDEISDNKLIIDNGLGPLISGDFANNNVRIGGTLAIGDFYRFPYGGTITAGKILKNDGLGNLSWENDEVEDNDSDPFNEVQTISKLGNTVTLSNGGGSFTDIGGGGHFTVDGSTLHLAQDENSTDFLFGRTDMPLNGELITDRFLMYDNSKYAFRGGHLINSDAWSPQNMGSSTFAYGYNTQARGGGAFAIGHTTIASGIYTLVGGLQTVAPSGFEVAFGRFNTDYIPSAQANWHNDDRLFVLGNGTSIADRKDAFTIMKNGDATIAGSLTMTDGTDSYTLPNIDGSKNQVLKTDGKGVLSWTDEGTANLSGLWTENGPKNLYHTQRSISIGTSFKKGNVNIFSEGPDPTELNITSTSNGTSQIRFSEDSEGNIGMGWRYHGADESMQLFGYYKDAKVENEYGPHIHIERRFGNIAIGSNKFATGYKVSINGKLACEEVLVKLDGDFPAHVLARDYKLRTIEELEDYLHKEKHLPGIASAAEINENGIKIGAMQKSLIEKVEELSLYIIQLNKQNIALQERISSLETSK